MITVVTPPATEPLSLAEARLFLREDNDEEDALITALIVAARQAAEQELGRYLINQTLEQALDRFPGDYSPLAPRYAARCDYLDPYEIRLPPVQSVTSISYVDLTGALQVLAADQYAVDVRSRPARITPAYATFWPYAREQRNAVIIRFVAGYGEAEAVPECIKHWMKLRIKAAYDHRDVFALDPRAAFAQLPDTYINGLLDPERVLGWR